MRLSQQLFVTLRDDPADAEVRSHALMMRAGFLQKLAAGIYVYGPMMWRVLQKVENIVREEHNKVGAQEMLMPAIQPKELWEESARWERYVQDGILFNFKDRKGSEVCLGPTHEEVITKFVASQVQSYKQLSWPDSRGSHHDLCQAACAKLQAAAGDPLSDSDEISRRDSPAFWFDARARVHHERCLLV